jgi:hypothetical protein
MRDGYRRKMKGVFIAHEASCGYSNVYHFGSLVPTQVRCFENHTSYTGYPDGQAICPNF